MANKDLKCEPHNIDNNWWWYEEKGGICVVHEPCNATTYRTISWKSIRAALKRKDKKNEKD